MQPVLDADIGDSVMMISGSMAPAAIDDEFVLLGKCRSAEHHCRSGEPLRPAFPVTVLRVLLSIL